MSPGLQPAPQHCLSGLTASFFLLLVPTYKLLPSTHGTATFLSPPHANHTQASEPVLGPTSPVELSPLPSSQDSLSLDNNLPMLHILHISGFSLMLKVCLFFLLNLGPVSLVVCTFLCILITPLCRRQSRCGFNPWVRKILWKRNGQPISVFSPGKFHGQRSLVGYRISKNQTHLSD